MRFFFFFSQSSKKTSFRIWDLRKSNQCVMTCKDDSYRSGLNWGRACWSPDCRFGNRKCRKCFFFFFFLCNLKRYVAAGGAEGSLFIWDIETGNVAKQLGTESNATISAVAWNPNGLQLATTDRKSKCMLWE